MFFIDGEDRARRKSSGYGGMGLESNFTCVIVFMRFGRAGERQ
jgi:hypothetical protein